MPRKLPSPYPEIYAELIAGRVIPFLGAGAPLYAARSDENTMGSEETGKGVY